MISGFVIFWTLNRIEHPLDFVISRFSRLFPAYWCSVILTFSVVFIYGLPGRMLSINDATLNFSMIQEYLLIPHVDGVYWALTVELTFYCWCFLLYVKSFLNKVEVIFSVVIITSVLHSLEVVHIHPMIYDLFIMKYLPFFMIGICTYKLTNGLHSKLTICALMISLFGTIAIFSFLHFFCRILSFSFWLVKFFKLQTLCIFGEHLVFPLPTSSKYWICNY